MLLRRTDPAYRWGEPGLASPLLDALRAAAGDSTRAREGTRRPSERIVIDVDATLIAAHTEEDAAVKFQRRFLISPLLAYLDDTRKALAGMLRAANAGAQRRQ